MAKKEVAVELTLTGDAFDRFADLTKQQTQARNSATALKKEIRELEKAYQAGAVDAKTMEREMSRLNRELAKQDVVATNASVQMREYRNELSGATTAGLRFRDKMADATKSALIPFGGVVGVVTAAVASAAYGIVSLTKELNTLSGQIQAQDRKAQIVFGEALDTVTAAAEENAVAMGLTVREYTNAAAGVQDLLVPLGFAREEAARNAVEVTNLAGALSLWSGGQVDAADAASRLQKGLLGETESLKELGIVIDQSSKEYNERIKVLMETEGLTKAQARALDILGQVQQQTTDAQTNYTDGTGSLIVQQAKANAELRQAKEELAENLTPAFIAATEAQANFTSGMALLTKETSTFQERLAGLISQGLGPAGPIFRQIISAVYGQWEATELAGLSLEQLEKKYAQAVKTAEMYRAKGQEIKAISYEAEAAKIQDEIATRNLNATLRDFVANGDPFTQTAEEQTKALEDLEPVLRVITDDMRAWAKAQQDIESGVGIGQMDFIMPELDSASTLKYAEDAEVATEATDKLTDSQKRLLDQMLLFSQAVGTSLEAAFKDAEEGGQRFILALVEMIRSAVRLYLAGTLAKEMFEKGPFGAITFAAIATAVEAAFAAATVGIQGFAEGGYTGHGTKYEPAGVVHKGEYVIPKTGVLAAGGPEFFDQLMSLLTGVKPRNYDGLFYTGGPATRGVAMVNMAGPGPSGPMMAQAELAAYLKTVPPPMVEVSEINRVQNRVRVVEQRSSF